MKWNVFPIAQVIIQFQRDERTCIFLVSVKIFPGQHRTGKCRAYSKIFRFKGDIFVSICTAGNIRMLVPRTNKNAMLLQPFPSLFRPICSYSRFESITDRYQGCWRKFYILSVISFVRTYIEKWKRPRWTVSDVCFANSRWNQAVLVK